MIATIFTFVVTIHAIWSYHRSNPFNGSGKVFIIMRLVLEILIFFLWIAAATLMLRHKGGCEDRVLSNGQDTCFDKHGKPEGGIKWTDHPVISWDVAVVFSFIEM